MAAPASHPALDLVFAFVTLSSVLTLIFSTRMCWQHEMRLYVIEPTNTPRIPFEVGGMSERNITLQSDPELK